MSIDEFSKKVTLLAQESKIDPGDFITTLVGLAGCCCATAVNASDMVEQAEVCLKSAFSTALITVQDNKLKEK